MDKEQLGKKIVEKCAGLPLAIVLLGGLLGKKHSVTEWDNVHNNFDLYLKRGKGTDDEYFDVHWVLALSYNELPYQLKSCFLHLGHFPEDYDIPSKTLIRMWVAEGFVSIDGARNETMEDVAERYLDDLVDRSIVQVSQMGSIGKLNTCRLHDLMRDFCLSKAHDENYLKIAHSTILKEKLNSNRVHRLVLHQNDINGTHLGYYAKTSYLRSFLLILPEIDYHSITISFTDFKLLKVLSFKYCRIGKKMRKEIGGLIHLRYLAFEECFLEPLPSSIGNLRYLQTLIIHNNGVYPPKIELLPNVLWKFEQLRHLVLQNLYLFQFCYGSLKLGNMRELQTLNCDTSYINIPNIIGLLSHSSNLKNLRLSIARWDEYSKIPSVNLSWLSSRCPQLVKLSWHGKMKNELPEWQHFPPNLTKLTLNDCFPGEIRDPLSILEKLPNLQSLCLMNLSFFGRLLVCSSKGFPQLQTLLLEDLSNLEEWRVDEGAMPNLSKLKITHCDELKMIPEGIKFITTLRQLEIHAMPQEFVDRIRAVDGKEGEDFYKVRHVPSIIIGYTYC